jgi:hypothetical protein
LTPRDSSRSCSSFAAPLRSGFTDSSNRPLLRPLLDCLKRQTISSSSS